MNDRLKGMQTAFQTTGDFTIEIRDNGATLTSADGGWFQLFTGSINVVDNRTISERGPTKSSSAGELS